jgi:YVTN family beta-propeller protein
MKWLVVLSAVLVSLAAPLEAGAQPRAYVSNSSSTTVSVIDTVSNAVVATVPVGSRPWHVAFTPDGSEAWVANLASGTVSVIDTASTTVVATVPIGVGVEPSQTALTPDGAFAYVVNFQAFTVSVVATATRSVVATIGVGGNPLGIVISPDGSRAYVTNWADGTVSIVSTASNTVIATVPAGTSPRNIAARPDGRFLYITNESSDRIAVLDTIDDSLALVPVGSFPCGVASTPAGDFVYVANCASNDLSIIETATNTVVATIGGGVRPTGVAFTPDGAFAYVTNYFTNAVSVIDTGSGSIVATVGVGAGASAVAVTPSALAALSPARLWVGLRNSDDVGTAFDVRVEMLKNALPVASGLTRCVKGLARNPAGAREIEVAFEPFAAVAVGPADVLALRVLTRIGTNPDDTRCTGTGAGHSNATGLRLYYDAVTRASRFDLTMTPGASENHYLRSDGGACPGGGGQSAGITTLFLDPTAPAAAGAKCRDSGGVKFSGGNPWREIGVWGESVP